MFASTLTTERLALRPVREDDAPLLNERVSSRPEVTRYLSGPKTGSLDETRTFLAESVAQRAAGEAAVWAITLRGSDDPWGTVGALRRDSRAVVGYALAREQWGRGLMSEAAGAMIDALWRDDSLWRVEALCHVDHAASARVLEKCGLRPEGVARRRVVMPRLGPTPQDCSVFAQVRDDVR